MATIFLSGPMFDGADLWEQGQIQSVLQKAGYDTYLASQDGVEDEELIANLKSPLIEMSEFQKLALLVQKLGWTLDIYMATYGCDAMVFNMNGRVPDEGSVAEAANAFAVGMPVVTFKSTSITMWGPFDNPMIAALDRSWHPVTTYDAIPPAVAAAITNRDPDYHYAAPKYFADALQIGKFVRENRTAVMDVLLKISSLLKEPGKDLQWLWTWVLDHLGIGHLATTLLDAPAAGAAPPAAAVTPPAT
jgi:nucleoside 2-deoxyribosyltransferase